MLFVVPQGLPVVHALKSIVIMVIYKPETLPCGSLSCICADASFMSVRYDACEEERWRRGGFDMHYVYHAVHLGVFYQPLTFKGRLAAARKQTHDCFSSDNRNRIWSSSEWQLMGLKQHIVLEHLCSNSPVLNCVMTLGAVRKHSSSRWAFKQLLQFTL